MHSRARCTAHNSYVCVALQTSRFQNQLLAHSAPATLRLYRVTISHCCNTVHITCLVTLLSGLHSTPAAFSFFMLAGSTCQYVLQIVAGQGLSLAVEDAVVLAWHLKQQGLCQSALRRYTSGCHKSDMLCSKINWTDWATGCMLCGDIACQPGKQALMCISFQALMERGGGGKRELDHVSGCQGRVFHDLHRDAQCCVCGAAMSRSS